MNLRTIISGTGSFIPDVVVTNSDFLEREFYLDGKELEKSSREVVDHVKEVTGIVERRYVGLLDVNSDLAVLAAEKAMESAGIDKETLDAIIVTHNSGNIFHGETSPMLIPYLASRVKSKLGIENPSTIPKDVIQGCTGWLNEVIEADYMIRAGIYQRVLVIGSEVFSRFLDPHDRNSMVFSDGAGAVVLEGIKTDESIGIVAHNRMSDTTKNYNDLIFMGNSYNSEDKEGPYLKMVGRPVHKFVTGNVPNLMKKTLDEANLSVSDISKFIFHQSNAKTIELLLRKLHKTYGIKTELTEDQIYSMMPVTVTHLGNNSVASVPIILDRISRRKSIIPGKEQYHDIKIGDNLLLTTMGVGMGANSLVYRVP